MEFDLKKHTILLTLAGSQCYGTATPSSDVDVKGIACPPKDYYFSLLKSFEQADKPVHLTSFIDCLSPSLKEIAIKTKLEGSVYEITKYFKMLMEVNPNSLDTLFCDDADVLLITPMGQKIRDNRDIFLSKKVRYTFFSYSYSQMQRIKTHRNWLLLKAEKEPSREDFGLRPKTEIPKNQLDAVEAYVKKQMDSWETDITSEDDIAEPTKIKIREKVAFLLKELKISSTERFVAACNLVGFEENFILYLQKEREYEKALREHKQYLDWKRTRNEDRADLESKHGFDCYTEDTEFLTNRGWLLYNDVTENDKLATIKKDTGELEFQSYYERVKKPYTGEIFEFETPNTFCSVTPNHRMLISAAHRNIANNFSRNFDATKSKWEIQPAEAITKTFRSNYHIRCSLNQINDYEIDDNILTIIGAYVSEGSVAKKRTNGDSSVLSFSQLKNGRQEKYLKTIPNIKIYEYKRDYKTVPEITYTLANREIAKNVSEWCGELSENKHLPFWYTKLSAKQAKYLLDVLLSGDGTEKKYSNVYYTTSKELANQVQVLALIAGFPSKLWGPYPNKENLPIYQVYISKNKKEADCLKTRSKDNTRKILVENTNVVCFSVPNEILITRKRGKIAIQGNTKHGGHIYRLCLMCEELLTTGKLTVKRPDREQILAIRNGEWSYEQLVEWFEDKEKVINELFKTSTKLPDSPNRKKIDALMLEVMEDCFREQSKTFVVKPADGIW